jgi:hypothetical protein
MQKFNARTDRIASAIAEHGLQICQRTRSLPWSRFIRERLSKYGDSFHFVVDP